MVKERCFSDAAHDPKPPVAAMKDRCGGRILPPRGSVCGIALRNQSVRRVGSTWLDASMAAAKLVWTFFTPKFLVPTAMGTT